MCPYRRWPVNKQQFLDRISNCWELWLKRQSITGLDPSFTSRVNRCDCSVAIELCLKYPIRRVERLLNARRRHWLDKLRQGIFNGYVSSASSFSTANSLPSVLSKLRSSVSAASSAGLLLCPSGPVPLFDAAGLRSGSDLVLALIRSALAKRLLRCSTFAGPL